MNNIKQSFFELETDHTEIPQEDLNIDIKKRTNLFAWNGQFSPQFVEAELKRYSSADFTIFDPFAGSGTVLYESSRLGLKSYGTEINVSAYYIAKLYELCSISIEQRKSQISYLENLINKTDYTLEALIKILKSLEESSCKNIFSAFIILLDIYNHKIEQTYIQKKWDSLKETLISLPLCHNAAYVFNNDARQTKLQEDSIDLILTSPPYINVFNYHQKYRASVEALGFNVLAIAKSEVGANRKHRSNRLYTVIQYCIDMALSLKEANRVCKPKARMIYVVGRESTVLGYSFCNSELIYNIGTEIFGFNTLLKQERVFKNRYGQMIYEDIIHFENNSKCIISEDDISKKAKDIAIKMLSSKLSIENKNIDFLIDSINTKDKIKKSEVLNG